MSGPKLPQALALAAVLVVGASGAVTALGDTLILQAGLTAEASPLVGWLVSKRLLHPALAIAAFMVTAAIVRGWASNRYGNYAVVLFGAQLLLGALNVYLLAPVWMQLVHLAVADVIWVLLVLAAAEALTSGFAASGKKEGLSPA